MEFETLCIHGNKKKYDATGTVNVPIYQTATFAHPGVAQSTGYDYSRLQNPTREHVENTLAQMEAGIDALAFSTGMAAIAALMELFHPGDHIIATDDLYGGSHRLFQHISQKNGLTFDYVDTSDCDVVEGLVKENTKAIFLETPSNPAMQVTDIQVISEIAKKRDLLLIVDNTFLTPYFQQPLLLGADIVVHSGTKFLGGHNDTLAGFLVTNRTDLSEKLRFIHKTTGACLAPFDSFLIMRGMKTLPIRMDRQQASAKTIADFLKTHPAVTKVHYAGDSQHPGYEVSKRQTREFGAMISFSVQTEQMAKRCLENLNIIQFAESLGGTETLMTYPMLQTHADVPDAFRRAKGIDERFLRLSVGLEAATDLVADLAQALEG